MPDFVARMVALSRVLAPRHLGSSANAFAAMVWLADEVAELRQFDQSSKPRSNMNGADDVIVWLNNPRWGEADMCNDWRNHVLPSIKLRWDSLGLEAREIAYEMAEAQANAEYWD